MPAAWMLLASFLFACMGLCVKLGAGQFSTGDMVFYRGLIGVLMTGALLRCNATSVRTRHWREHLVRGISGSLALACYFYVIGLLPLATAVTLNYTSPLFVALLLTVGYRERHGAAVFAALLIGFAGVVILLRPTLQQDQWAEALAGLGTGLLASIAYIQVRNLGRLGEPEPRTVFWFSATTAACSLPWIGGTGMNLPSDPGQAAVLLGVGVFGTLAQLAMTRSYRYGKTLLSANLAYSTVVFASFFGMLLWDEHPPASAWLAIALIVASGVLVSHAHRPRTPAAARAPSGGGTCPDEPSLRQGAD